MTDTAAAPAAPLDNSPALGSTKLDLDRLLQAVQLLGSSEDRAKLDSADAKKWDGDTPISFQVLKSGATELTQVWTKWARNAGGGAALLSIIAGGIGGVFQGNFVPAGL